MATKKERPAAASAAKAAVGEVQARPAAQPAVTAMQDSSDSQRLLREAAWSRMFGRADTKNPFARSR